MANPPIVIGPFQTVPAPGSPIRSNWPQDISTVVTKAAWGPAGLGRITRPTDQGGFGSTEFSILSLTVPASQVGRLSNLYFGLILTATAQPGAVAALNVRVRQGSETGAILGGWVRYWQPGQQAASLPNVDGVLPLIGLPAAVIHLTFQASAGTYTIGAGSYFAGDDAGRGSL